MSELPQFSSILCDFPWLFQSVQNSLTGKCLPIFQGFWSEWEPYFNTSNNWLWKKLYSTNTTNQMFPISNTNSYACRMWLLFIAALIQCPPKCSTTKKSLSQQQEGKMTGDCLTNNRSIRVFHEHTKLANIVNFVFQYISSFLLYLHHIMLENVK